jgi:hypothetical protein
MIAMISTTAENVSQPERFSAFTCFSAESPGESQGQFWILLGVRPEKAAPPGRPGAHPNRDGGPETLSRAS